MKAFLDSAGNVIAIGSNPATTLTMVQAVHPTAVIEIDQAPDGLIAKDSSHPTWHKKGIQDGSDLSHYTEEIDNPDFVSALKLRRYDDIDLKTQSIILMGFSHSSMQFSMSVHAQLNWCVLRAYAGSYPKIISMLDSTTHSLPDAVDRDAFITAFEDALDAALTDGQDIKDLITVETTEAGVNSIIDSR